MSRHRTDKEVYVTGCEIVKSMRIHQQARTVRPLPRLPNLKVDMVIPEPA
jgi:hypothetical protein